MKNIHKNQRGIAALTIVGLILILGVVGFTGWRVWEARKDANQKLDSGSSSPAPAKPAAEKIPDGYVKYSKDNLTFYYPEDQQPAKDTTAESQKTNKAVVSSVGLKEISIAMYAAEGLELQMGIGASWVCRYSVKDSTFTLNTEKSFSNASCDKFNRKEEFNTIGFNNLSTGYESRLIYSYAAPTKDKKYLLKFTKVVDEYACYSGELSEMECENRSKQNLESLQKFMISFTKVNKTLFK